MKYQENSHCSYCGHPFSESQSWPRTCSACQNTTFLNPTPVVVMLVPVDEGVLLIRRGISPQKGKLAFPGGYIDQGESWQAAGARELREESGIIIPPENIQLFNVFSAKNIILIFGQTLPLIQANLPIFKPNNEVTERIIATEPLELAFPLHTQVMETFFRQQSSRRLT